MKYVGLLDCNNFFVSCERLFRPDLKNHPTVVLSSNDGCVVARSPEIKALGIPMGVPYFKVKKELQSVKAAIFSSNFTLYRDISRRVMRVVEELVEESDQYSIDEAFFVISGSQSEVTKQLFYIRGEVERRVGLPVSIGAGRTKTIAKIANHKAKQGSGACLLVGSSWKAIQTNVTLAEIWGIGRQTSSKMRQHDLVTVADLLAADRARVAQLFGVEGVRKWDELNEILVYKLNERSGKMQQSIMSTRSFAGKVEALSVIEDAISYHVAEAARELRELGAVAGALEVHVNPSRHGDWSLRGGKAGSVLSAPTSDTRILLKEALRLTRQLWEAGVPYRKAGVVLSMIGEADSLQPGLFTAPDSQINSLSTIVDQLNQRFGPRVVNFGRLKNDNGWQSNRTHLSPRYTTNWSEIAKVRV